MKTIMATVGCVLIVLAGGAVPARDRVAPTDTIVTTGSRSKVDLIGSDEIKVLPITNVAEILKTKPGVVVRRDNYHVRGCVLFEHPSSLESFVRWRIRLGATSPNWSMGRARLISDHLFGRGEMTPIEEWRLEVVISADTSRVDMLDLVQWLDLGMERK